MDEIEESEVIRSNLPCDSCGSSDGVRLYSDDHLFCFVCRKYTKGDSPSMAQKTYKGGGKRPPSDVIPYHELEQIEISARKISLETCKKFGYYVSRVKKDPVQVANYLDAEGDLVGQKIRWADKTILTFGKIPDVFWGQWLFKGGGKKLIICEGCIDCLTVSQVFGNKYPVVSIPKGSGSAKKTFLAQLKWLELFEEVVVCFDMDTAGAEAVQSVKGILSPKKLKIVTLPMKDPNEMLCAGRSSELINCIWGAELYRPENIVNGNDPRMREKVMLLAESTMGYPLPYNELNKKIMGLRDAELTLITAGSGIGKTTLLKGITHNLGTVGGFKVGCLFLEESVPQSIQSLMSQTCKLPLKFQSSLEEDERLSVEEWNKIYDDTVGSGNFVFFDHFGSMESDDLLNQIRYLAVAEECKYIVLDHISIVVSGLEGGNNSDVKVLDILMTKLAKLTQETGVSIICISHLRKGDGKGKSHEEGGKVTLDDLRGSGALKQLSFNIIALERNQQDDDETLKNVVHLKVLKCRHTGDTGYAGHLLYNKKTDMLEHFDMPSDAEEEQVEDLSKKFTKNNIKKGGF